MMTVVQQEAIDRNNRVIEYLEKNIDTFKDYLDFVLFYSKLKKDNARAILSFEIMKKDTNGSNVKVASKILVCNTAVDLCKKAMSVINLKEGADFSVAMQFDYPFFHETTDNLAIERLLKVCEILFGRYKQIYPSINKRQLNKFKMQIDAFYMADGSTNHLTKASVESTNNFKQDLILTNTDMKNILKCSEPYKTSLPDFEKGLRDACGIMVYRGNTKKKV